ncbi:unnamed protein product [Spirodela intermedia]|uniref:Uncharacterized protein n=1 Tax=Spirodela intermedia TaxID=51605 RepID=A0A7I8JJU7_SPIIN|nr:unnamed protein product [Spirodela intermedia]CAA6670055.1 unnamed protein product [Spirodela intermedia]
MAQKRHLEEEKGKGGMGYDGCSPGEKRQKVPDLGSVIVEVMKMNALQKLLSVIEPQLRRVVKEEVEMALAKHLATMKRQCGKQIYPSSSRSLQLQFVSKLSLPIFTGTKIEGEDCSGISLALVDTLTRKIVEIVVLEGDFEVEEEIWTFDEFKSNIVKEREGKRPLLSGDVFLDLTEGTGVLGELAFTDNSSWTRSRKFRLGARVEDGYFNGIRIREAKTEPFMVKDHRGELYKKHYPPSLADEVWRLEKIGKDGAFHKRLGSENINTVKDFLTMLHLDTQRLRNILGTGMSAKMWEVTVEHARTCVLGSQVYTYYPGRQQKTGVAFNIVGEVVGVVSDGQYVPAGELSEAQKADSHKLVKAAYEHWEEVSLCDGGAATGGSSHASSVSYTAGGQPLVESFYHEFSGSCRTDGFGFAHPTISSPEMISSVLPTAARRRSFDAAAASVLQAMDSIESRYDPGFLSHGLYADSGDLFPTSLIFDGESTSQPLFAGDGDDQLHYFDADAPLLAGGGLRPDSPADLGSAVTGFLAAAAARGKVNRSWRTLISVLKWRFSIKRIVSLRRKDRFGVGNPPQRDLPRG